MIKPITKRIGEHEYRFIHFGFDQWLKLQAELSGLGGPLIGAIVTMKRGGLVSLGPVIQDLAREILSSMNRGLLDRFYAAVSINAGGDGEKDRWTELKSESARNAWAGLYFEGYKVTEWVIEEAFVPFWTAVMNDGDGLLRKLDELGEKEGTEES